MKEKIKPLTDTKRSRAKRRLRDDQFKVILPLLSHLSDTRIEAARRALVAGETLQSISDDYGWSSRAAAGDAVDAVWSVWLMYEKTQEIANSSSLVPKGWSRVILIAPSQLVSKFQDEIINFINTHKNVQK